MIKWLVGESFCICLTSTSRGLDLARITDPIQGRKTGAALSQCFTGKPIDVGLGEVQEWTSKLLTWASKLQSDANVETNVVVKKTQDEIKRANTITRNTQSATKELHASTRHIEENTEAILL